LISFLKMKTIKFNHTRKLRICFVAHEAYGAMTGGKSGQIGGVERQTSLIARWFAQQGYQVSILTWDEGGPPEEIFDGVRVIKLCRSNAGIAGLRFLWPRWTSLNPGLRRADADIYYQNCAECVTGQVTLWCRRHGRKFVYSTAADTHCNAKLPYMHSFRDRFLYRYGLKHADKIIVQSQKQQEMMQKNFGQNSIVLPMPCPGPNEEDYRNLEAERNDLPRILWIGRIYKVKRPDRLLDIAESHPEFHFDIVGPAINSEYARNVCQKAKTKPNITMHGPIPRDRVSEFYRKATIMCCTSDSEGFPNTFLEAWSYGLPIVSTFDPDNLIARRGLGIAASDVPALAKGIKLLIDSPQRREKAAQAARQYYLENHTINVALPKFENVFLSAVNDSEI
jgi:glycosyltransferase involved in cell wall biosynthesis